MKRKGDVITSSTSVHKNSTGRSAGLAIENYHQPCDTSAKRRKCVEHAPASRTSTDAQPTQSLRRGTSGIAHPTEKLTVRMARIGVLILTAADHA